MIIDKDYKKNNFGFSLLELVIALAVFFILASGVMLVVTSSYNNFFGKGDKQSVANFAKEGLEAVQSIAANNWIDMDNAVGADRGLIKNSSTQKWEFSGSSNVLGSLTRVINVMDVQRNNGEIVESGGTDDPLTKRVTIAVSGAGISTYRLAIYLTSWGFSTWEQSNWQDGNGYVFWRKDGYFDNYTYIDYSVPGEIKITSTEGKFDESGTLESSAISTYASDKKLYKLEVYQDVPSGCVNEIIFSASNTSDFGGTPATQTFNETSDYYVANFNTSMSNYDWLKYQVNMTYCNDTSESPTLYSIKVYYR